MEYKDYYKSLELPRTATKQDIDKQYRKLPRKYHPDLNPGNKAAETRFKEINEAHEVLTDEEKKKKYDTLGQNWNRPGFDIHNDARGAATRARARATGDAGAAPGTAGSE